MIFKYTAINAELKQIFNLRHAVLREGKPLESAHFPADDIPETRHFAVISQTDNVVGCITAVQSEWNQSPAWQLRGMATHPEYRNKGIGRKLMRFVEQELAKDSYSDVLWCNARESAFEFYIKNGWRFESQIFEVPGIGPHKKMAKFL